MALILDADVVLPAPTCLAPNGYWVMNNKALGYAYVHRWMAEKCLGRPLPRGAVVHHVNYDKEDNRRSNLVVCPDRAYHALLHMRTDILNAGGKYETHRICGACKECLLLERFARDPSQHGGLKTTCRACVAKQAKARREKEPA